MSYPVIAVEQPAGTFYLTAMPALEVIRMSRANPRIFDPQTLTSQGGVQRDPSARRVKAISEYADSSDAAFPTILLLAIESQNCTLEDDKISVRGEKVADIVDGQHRILGLSKAVERGNFVLPVVFIIDATEEEKALLFATINGTQTKVPASLIYELYGVTESRSPAKTCHEIARSLNSMPESPWYRRLKMLGRKSVAGSTESLSQGTFVKFLMPHISTNPAKDMDLLRNNQPPLVFPKCIFNEYFREGKDSLILKVLLNTFQGARSVWPVEWDDPAHFVLTKTLGFSGIMRALPDMVNKGRSQNDLSVGFFSAIFERVKRQMEAERVTLTSEHFSASASGETEFREIIRRGTKTN
jgi:DGQHR domain-containing protein